MRAAWLGLAALAAVGVGASVWTAHLPQDRLETITFTRPLVSSAPGLCPWRDPKGDLRAFFPGADRYQTRLLALSGLRLPILKRLGPGASLEDNTLQSFPVFQGSVPQGAVLVQRAAGEYGAMEIVVGVDTSGRVRGVRLQRMREPDAVAQALMDPAWLASLRGKTAGDAWRLGADLPDRPASARDSARLVALTVRGLLIEYDEARKHGELKP